MSKLTLNNCGVMFHHFHSKKHVKTQGSISKTKLEKIIKKIGVNNIVSAKSFFKNKQKICLTFDDGLKCQYDIALPILNKYKIKAFWFIYTSALKSNESNLELFRIFRNKKFKNFDTFYRTFKLLIKNKSYEEFLNKEYKKMKIFKKNFPFYSVNEIKFRFLRDKFLNTNEYYDIIKKLYKMYNFNYKREFKNIFLTARHIKKLSNNGHLIGLHTHSHPTNLPELSVEKQKNEYLINKKILEKIIKNKIFISSHPCGKYSDKTLKILRDMGISLSFNAQLDIDKKYIKTIYQNLTIPREDHANL